MNGQDQAVVHQSGSECSMFWEQSQRGQPWMVWTYPVEAQWPHQWTLLRLEPPGRGPRERPKRFMADVKEDRKLIGFREDAEDPCSLSSPCSVRRSHQVGQETQCGICGQEQPAANYCSTHREKKASPFSPAPLVSLLVAQSRSLRSILERCECTEICTTNASIMYPILKPTVC